MGKYSIEVNDDYTFELEQKEGKLLNQGEVLDIDSIEIKAGQFHIIYKHKSYNAEVIAQNPDEKTFTIRVNSNDYTLSLKNKYDLLLDKLGLTNLSAGKARASTTIIPVANLRSVGASPTRMPREIINL